jgi:peptidyl-prolyl cis-trans isomerase SurA
MMSETIAARGMEMPPEDELIRETLDRLILESIQMQMGARYGVRISDAQLDAAMARVAAQNRLNLEQFARGAGAARGAPTSRCARACAGK